MTQAACRFSDLPSRMAVKSSGPGGRCWLWTSDGKGEGRPGYRQRLPSCEARQSLPAVCARYWWARVFNCRQFSAVISPMVTDG